MSTAQKHNRQNFEHNRPGPTCVSFLRNTAVIINNNSAIRYVGVLYIKHNSEVAFEGNPYVVFNNSQATCGGSIYIEDNSSIKFGENSTVAINNSQAAEDGGAFYIWLHSNVIYEGKSDHLERTAPTGNQFRGT